MKKISIFLAACNIFFLAGCGSSEKKPGEEYYDPDYKPQTNQTAQSGTQTAETNSPATRGARKLRCGLLCIAKAVH